MTDFSKIKRKKIFLDTSIFIHIVEEDEFYQNKIKEMINNLGEFQFYIAGVAPLECSGRYLFPYPFSDKSLEPKYLSYFDSVRITEMSFEVYFLSGKLKKEHPNCESKHILHLASAIINNCDEFWTDDLTLKNLSPNIVKVFQ